MGTAKNGPKFWIGHRDGIEIHVGMISRVASRIWLPDALIWTVDLSLYTLPDQLAAGARDYSLVSLDGKVWWHEQRRDSIPEQYGINSGAFSTDARAMTFEVASRAVEEAFSLLEDLISVTVSELNDGTASDVRGRG